MVINEVDYDQPGTDTAEFLELKNTSAVAVNLDPYVVELVNGSGGAVYGTFDLPAVNLAGGDYYVICADATTTANCDLDVTPDSNLIQNGSPDGLRLLLAGTTVDALSYEGDTAGATEGSGTGLEDLAGDGLSRCPDGKDTDANNVDFSLRATTPGTTNRARRRRSSSTRSTTTRSGPTQPSSSSSRTRLLSRSTSIRTSSSS